MASNLIELLLMQVGNQCRKCTALRARALPIAMLSSQPFYAQQPCHLMSTAGLSQVTLI